jgi:hypothetical protein
MASSMGFLKDDIHGASGYAGVGSGRRQKALEELAAMGILITG